MTIASISMPADFCVSPHTFSDREDFLRNLPKKYHQYTLADGAANADLAATVVFSPTGPVLVTDITVTPDGSVTGVDDSNTSVWVAANGATAMVTTTYNTANAFPADNAQESLGTITNGLIPAGGRVDLTVTNGTAADLPAVVVTIEYVDLNDLPGGLKALGDVGGSVSVSDAAGGILSLVTGATDNNELYLASNREVIKFAANKPMVIDFRVKLAQANTDDLNCFIGLMDGVAADSIQDNGAGPKASFDGAGFFTKDGSTRLFVVSSNAATQTITETELTAAQSTYQLFRVQFLPISSTEGQITFYVDQAGGQNPQQVREYNTNPRVPLVVHTVTLTGLEEMALVVGAKAGGANAETVLIDYIQYAAVR